MGVCLTGRVDPDNVCPCASVVHSFFEETGQMDMRRQVQFLTESPFPVVDARFLVLTKRFWTLPWL